ncbi:MAG: hypothetical protein ABI681_12695 [Gemmatimonadales bacterium]
MSRVVFSIAILALCATTAEGQSDSVLTRALSDSSSIFIRRLSQHLPGEKPQIGSIRLASSAGGFVFGLVVGGFSGYEMSSVDCTKSCRNSQNDALITGAAIGGAIGAALGAAFLDLKSICPFEKRLMRALIGSGIGASTLFIAARGWDRQRSISVIPIGAVGGSLATLGRCWKSRYW